MALYLLKSRHWLDYYINQYKDFYNEIKSSYTYFDHMRPMHQLNIIEIIVLCKIIRKLIASGYKVYNNKRDII